ncbi:hypothetical protein [Streptomyces virginiae]|uniref:hypothetical protein n=1 Tax=Streptomyces virginiae TaxID=1961 RepID=UPI0036F9633F
MPRTRGGGIVTEPGPLHRLVRSGERLELLLLGHCVASGNVLRPGPEHPGARWALAAPFDLNINKTDREVADTMWTVDGAARTAARFAASLPAPPAAAEAAPAAAP